MLSLDRHPRRKVIVYNKNWPLFFDAPKCRPIYRNSKNIVLTSVLCMEIYKLCYTLTPEQPLETWNYRNVTKDFARHLFDTLSVRYLLIWQCGHSFSNAYFPWYMIWSLGHASIAWYSIPNSFIITYISLDMCVVKYLTLVIEIHLTIYKIQKNKSI